MDPAAVRRWWMPPGWLAVALVSLAASILRVLADGQDLNFDLVTYHYYLGFSAFADRAQLDFLPASFQGYQSPLPYALLYWLDSVGVPPALNAALHAAVHALNLVVLFFLCKLLAGHGVRDGGRTAPALLWLLGAVAPVYWQLVGTSFADLTTSLLVLCGLWLVAVSLHWRARQMAWRPALLAGALLTGCAIGMRMHNAIYLPALCVAVAAACPSAGGAEKLRSLGAVAGAALVGVLACFGPWGWRNYAEFGNPVFPFFNGIFRSSDFPAGDLALTSFVPGSIADLLALPFRIATYADWMYVEKNLPDVRPALLVLTVAAFVVMRVCRRGAGLGLCAPADDPARSCIVWFFASSAVLWLATSCNGRYGVALFLLAGPVCGALLLRLLPMRHVVLAVAAVVAWQAAVQHAFFALPRWSSGSWSARYFDWDLPERLKREPAVFMGFGYKSASTLAPLLHPQSRHVNLVGQYAIAADGPGSERVRKMIGAADRRIYGVFDFYYTQQSDPAARSIKGYFAEHLQTWGLGFTETPCTQVALKAAPAAWEAFNRVFGISPPAAPPEHIVCELRPIPAGARDQAWQRWRAFSDRLARLATACPAYFGVPLSIERHPGQWMVTSFASLEFRMEFYDAGLVVLQQTRPPYVGIALGEFLNDTTMPGAVDCREWRGRLNAQAQAIAR